MREKAKPLLDIEKVTPVLQGRVLTPGVESRYQVGQGVLCVQADYVSDGPLNDNVLANGETFPVRQRNVARISPLAPSNWPRCPEQKIINGFRGFYS